LELLCEKSAYPISLLKLKDDFFFQQICDEVEGTFGRSFEPRVRRG